MRVPVTACRRDTRRVRRPLRGVPGSPERAPRGPGRVAVSEAGPGTALQGAVIGPGESADGQGSSEPLPSVEVRFGFGGEAGNCIRAGPCRGTGSAAAVFGRRPARRGPGGERSRRLWRRPFQAPQAACGRWCRTGPASAGTVRERRSQPVLQALAGQEFGVRSAGCSTAAFGRRVRKAGSGGRIGTACLALLRGKSAAM